ncbi:beta-ketoacyl-ACP synthase I [Maricurvus nonylphenolicus]|uniref:beta-ketoacyl-[acyl-carrier-protein] synthase family protein n=1 Tax=Maricurvus nonylphenolicus TaxID=1008307 RepID=UPI0036F1B171
MRRRIVITGLGILSSIGNSVDEVSASLRDNRSGLAAVPEWVEYGFKSRVAGTVKMPDVDSLRKDFGIKARFMDVTAIHTLICAEQAIADSGLSPEDLNSIKTGCIASSGFSSASPFQEAIAQLQGQKKMTSAFEVTRAMASSVSANLSNYYGIRGRSYSMSSACATSVHNVGHGAELIQQGICDLVIAGGAEEVSPVYTSMFEGMRKVLSKSYNDQPQKASRAFDKDRDGFVISGGAGVVILEEYDRAVARGAPIYGEIIGFGTSTDGHDIIQPHPGGEGCQRCMEVALENAGISPAAIDYINAHGTATPAGDLAETIAIRNLFDDHPVKISSTKSLTGHGIGAAGVHELIYCLLMMKEGFVTASVNIDNMDSAFEDLNIVTANQVADLNTVMTNSFGFGGTNGSLIVSKV